MLFNSIDFLIFFPVVFILYFSFPHKYRWVWLLACSYFFYMSWNPTYIFLIVFSTVVDYFAGIKIYQAKKNKLKKRYLVISLVSNFGLLFFFKYYNFFIKETAFFLLENGVDVGNNTLNIILPVGISFYTFQTLSYTIDIYRGALVPEKHFGKFALFVSFFPQLVAGPIERASHLLPQMSKKMNMNYANIVAGLRKALWGFFKKVAVADRLGILVDNVYSNPELHSAPTLLMATYFFAFQIYCDFSGYSDIAIGIARMMGFDLMENFKRPYLSKSITEFWRRWHISLSTWFRDYLYISIGGNKVKTFRNILNLFVVFVVSGFWHGANWTFMIWGAFHGIYLIIEKYGSKLIQVPSNRLTSGFRLILTFHLVLLGWVFFRANTVADATYILNSFFSKDILSGWNAILSQFGVDTNYMIYSLFTLTLLILADFYKTKITALFYNIKNSYFRLVIYAAMILIIIFFGEFGNNQFIYFQF